MPLKFGNAASLFQSMLYTDELTTYRHDTVMIGDGTTRLTQLNMDLPFQSGVACRISFGTPDNPQSMAEDFNKKNIKVVIFCAPDVDVIKGDYLVVHRIDDVGNVLATYQGRAGLPSQFTTHKEIQMEETQVA